MPTEADTCRNLAAPKRQAAGWDNEPHSIAPQEGKPDATPFDLLCHLDFNALRFGRPQRADYPPSRVEAHRQRLLAVKHGEMPWADFDAWRKDLDHQFLIKARKQ